MIRVRASQGNAYTTQGCLGHLLRLAGIMITAIALVLLSQNNHVGYWLLLGAAAAFFLGEVLIRIGRKIEKSMTKSSPTFFRVSSLRYDDPEDHPQSR
jgi:hypothetical protein